MFDINSEDMFEAHSTSVQPTTESKNEMSIDAVTCDPTPGELKDVRMLEL